MLVAVDAGTSSTRVLVFDEALNVVFSVAEELPRRSEAPGWADMDAAEMAAATARCLARAAAGTPGGPGGWAAVGVANQRETVVAWRRSTGAPLAPALLWMDTRTAALVEELGKDPRMARALCVTGLQAATYFSAFKMAWLLRHAPAVRAAADAGDLCLGTVDAFLVWTLTGGPSGGRFCTDVSNASRTLLMDLASCAWDDECLALFGVPRACLPDIVSSAEDHGPLAAAALGLPPLAARARVCACLGDQQAALLGHACRSPGQAKCTYGTGCFLLYNTGTRIVRSNHRLLTTVAYRLGPHAPVVYALEGSVATAGAALRWLRDGIGVLRDYAEVDTLAASVPDAGGVSFVPALSGLFAPHWRPDARGCLSGLSEGSSRAHIVRATLDGVACQVDEILRAMQLDSSCELVALNVDGGMTASRTLLQCQADVLGIPVCRPHNAELTALGAAYAAGLAAGILDADAIVRAHAADAVERVAPRTDAAERARVRGDWASAVQRVLRTESS